jgi:hypothetical protein
MAWRYHPPIRILHMAPANCLTIGWRISSLYRIPVSAQFLMMYKSADPWVRRLEFSRGHAEWQICHLRPAPYTNESIFFVDFNFGRRRTFQWLLYGSTWLLRRRVCYGVGGIFIQGSTELYIIRNGALTGIRYREQDSSSNRETICWGHRCRIHFNRW